MSLPPNLGFLLKDAARRFVLRFEQHARELSLTLPQCRTLVRLEANPGVSQAKLAELVDVDAMTMVRILDYMEADGLLERRVDPTDRRVRCIYLTRKAKPVLEKIWHLSNITRNEAFSGVRREDRELFIEVLERVHANLAEPDGKGLDARTPDRASSGTGS